MGSLSVPGFASEAFPDPDSSRWLCSEIPSDEFPDGNNDQHLCDEDLDSLFQQQAAQMDFDARQQGGHVELEWTESEKVFDPDEIYGDAPNPTIL